MQIVRLFTSGQKLERLVNGDVWSQASLRLKSLLEIR